MESCCTVADLKKPLLEAEEVVEVVSPCKPQKNELDVTYHVSSLCFDEDEEEEEDEVLEEDGDDESSCTESFIMWVILPTLLFSQFGMAFLMHDERTATMSWTIVNLSIALFVITSWLYRHACKDANITTVAIVLLPEIVMDVVLGLVLFNQVALGFMVLLVNMLFLSTFVVIASASFLYCGRKANAVSDKETREEMYVCQVV